MLLYSTLLCEKIPLFTPPKALPTPTQPPHPTYHVPQPHLPSAQTYPPCTPPPRISSTRTSPSPYVTPLPHVSHVLPMYPTQSTNARHPPPPNYPPLPHTYPSPHVPPHNLRPHTYPSSVLTPLPPRNPPINIKNQNCV